MIEMANEGFVVMFQANLTKTFLVYIYFMYIAAIIFTYGNIFVIVLHTYNMRCVRLAGWCIIPYIIF